MTRFLLQTARPYGRRWGGREVLWRTAAIFHRYRNARVCQQFLCDLFETRIVPLGTGVDNKSFRRDRRGITAITTALVLPLLCLVILGGIDLSMEAAAVQNLAFSTSQASVGQANSMPPPAVQAQFTANLLAYLTSPSLMCTPSPGSITCTGTATYSHPSAGIFTLFGGGVPATTILTNTATASVPQPPKS